MKKTLSILITGIVAFGCSNMDIEFDDFEYQSIFFPYQTPVRTIILGDESIGDNSIDLEHAFSIGISMGGAYENKKNRIVSVEYAPELGQNIKYINNKDTLGLEVLPAAYYEAVFDQIIIPSGEFSGKMRVDLKDAFFNDPLSATTHYVIPTRITDAGTDTILSGSPNGFVVNPDPRIAEDWDIVPKNYTLFGIKYINETHGMYLLRGSRINSSTGEEVTYSERFLVDNNMTKLTTKSLTENIMDVVGGSFTGNFYRILLTFNKDNKTVTVSSVDATTTVVSGTGVYYTKDDSEAESFNGFKHRTVYLDYTIKATGKDYYVKDSLVFADTDVMFEEFKVIVVDP